jgi:hypothetical protein
MPSRKNKISKLDQKARIRRSELPISFGWHHFSQAVVIKDLDPRGASRSFRATPLRDHRRQTPPSASPHGASEGSSLPSALQKHQLKLLIYVNAAHGGTRRPKVIRQFTAVRDRLIVMNRPDVAATPFVQTEQGRICKKSGGQADASQSRRRFPIHLIKDLLLIDASVSVVRKNSPVISLRTITAGTPG